MHLTLYHKKKRFMIALLVKKCWKNYFCYFISLWCNVPVLKILLSAMQFPEFHVIKEQHTS